MARFSSIQDERPQTRRWDKKNARWITDSCRLPYSLRDSTAFRLTVRGVASQQIEND
jgi:hypothetical protein